MKLLYVLYDGSCGLCWRAVRRLAHEPSYIPLRFEPASSSFSLDRFADALVGTNRNEVVVIADTGEVWRGTSAWIMVLYALRRYRPLAMRLATPAWRPLAAKAIDIIGRYRHACSEFFGLSPEPQILAQVHAAARANIAPPIACTDGTCAPPQPLAPDITPLDRLIEARQRTRADWPSHSRASTPPIAPPIVRRWNP